MSTHLLRMDFDGSYRFRRLSLERNSGSPNPLHRDAVIAALNEKRKRIQTEEPDDASSVASSAGVIAKRRWDFLRSACLVEI